MSAIAPVYVSGILDHTLARLTTSATVGTDSTLSPEGKNPQGIVSWVDRSGGIATGYPRLTMQVRAPQKGNRNYKVSVRLALPTLEATSASTYTGVEPGPIEAYRCSFIGEFIIPERSTSAERTKLFSQAASLFADLITASDGNPTQATGSPLKAAVTTFEAVY